MASVRMVHRGVQKVVCVGKNYAAHAAEMGTQAKELPKQPSLFLKPPSSIVHPPGPIQIPQGVEAHYEVEMGLVIGDGGADIEEKNALQHLAGVVCCIDVTARNLQTLAKKQGNPWTVSKGYDTFLPISDMIPIDKVSDVNNVGLQLQVNGDVKQKDTTKNMIHSVESLVSYISSVMELTPGDLILTGTPSGVGPMVKGDVVEARLDGLVDMKFYCEDR